MHHRVHEEKMQHSSQDLRNEREKIGTILEKADFFECCYSSEGGGSGAELAECSGQWQEPC